VGEVFVKSIGTVRSTRTEIIDDGWDAEEAWIDLDESQFSDDALAGLDGFSHVEVVFLMDRVEDQSVVTGARHPRGNPDWPKVGVFAQRVKNRPNRIGTTICRVLVIQGTQLRLLGLDAVDGTPVLDIKPWMSEFGPRGEVSQPEWSRELMKNYWRDEQGIEPTR
jgi:tRNA-Thr(GGU) m(6)t(6)A37 methyltransferase TsaA